MLVTIGAQRVKLFLWLNKAVLKRGGRISSRSIFLAGFNFLWEKI